MKKKIEDTNKNKSQNWKLCKDCNTFFESLNDSNSKCPRCTFLLQSENSTKIVEKETNVTCKTIKQVIQYSFIVSISIISLFIIIFYSGYKPQESKLFNMLELVLRLALFVSTFIYIPLAVMIAYEEDFSLNFNLFWKIALIPGTIVVFFYIILVAFKLALIWDEVSFNIYLLHITLLLLLILIVYVSIKITKKRIQISYFVTLAIMILIFGINYFTKVNILLMKPGTTYSENINILNPDRFNRKDAGILLVEFVDAEIVRSFVVKAGKKEYRISDNYKNYIACVVPYGNISIEIDYGGRITAPFTIPQYPGRIDNKYIDSKQVKLKLNIEANKLNYYYYSNSRSRNNIIEIIKNWATRIKYLNE
jgi:hypothetical protein